MTFNPDHHHRRSIRLQGYDYTRVGAYFVTVCTQNRECLFGDIMGGEMQFSEAGQMVHSVWKDLPRHYPRVQLNVFVVMPNHVHGIVVLNPPGSVGAGPRACPDSDDPRSDDPRPEQGQPRGVAPTMSLPEVVHRFKSLTTARYRHGVAHNRWRPFLGRLWQRNYYEHVIRGEAELGRVRQYIVDNPLRWAVDRENPAAAVARVEEPWQV